MKRIDVILEGFIETVIQEMNNIGLLYFLEILMEISIEDYSLIF